MEMRRDIGMGRMTPGRILPCRFRRDVGNGTGVSAAVGQGFVNGQMGLFRGLFPDSLVALGRLKTSTLFPYFTPLSVTSIILKEVEPTAQ